MEVFHRDIGFPAWWRPPTERVRLWCGEHTEQRLLEYGVQLPETLDLSEGVIEVAGPGTREEKLLVRMALRDGVRDLCVVVTRATGFVRTVWVNLSNDRHSTLNKSRYAKP